ncbi:MAG: DUF1616 domain-containing protein [Thermoplasmatota archaeon]
MTAQGETRFFEVSEHHGEPAFLVPEFTRVPITGVADTIVGGVAAVVAGAAFALLPAGSIARVALTVPALFVLPGYLLLEASLSPRTARPSRAFTLLAAIGVSPILVSVLALATTRLPGGFRPDSIVAVITVACVALAIVATTRRLVTKPKAS